MLRIKTLLTALILSLPLAAGAQSVGLVMSGGGAKGLYHIGVIKALEENGIPIDYVSGTSMGAIVGGLYSVGKSPQEMVDLALSPQIGYWMSGKIEDKYLYYFKAMHPSAAMLTLRFGPENKKTPGCPPT